MAKKVTAIGLGFVFLWSSFGVSAEEIVTPVEPAKETSDSSVVMNFDQQAALRRMLIEIKPAAGEDAKEIESPRRIPYWEQKVVRRKRRTLTE